MIKTCEECNEALVAGKFRNTGSVVFVPLTECDRLSPKQSVVVCDACPKCGRIYNIRLRNPEEIVRK